MVASRTHRFLGLAALACLPLGVGSCFGGPSGGTSAPLLSGPDSGASQVLAVVDAGGEIVLDAAPGALDASQPSSADAGPTEGLDADVADACTGSIAVLGGTVAGASTIAFAATLVPGGAWSVTSLPSNVASPPAIAAFGGGFVAVYVDNTGDLEFATSTWSWSSPGGVSGVTATGAPSLAVVGSTLHLVYQGAGSKYVHGTYTAGAGWDAADDPIGGASKQGFGPATPVAASVGGALVIAYGGQNGSLYDETWTGGAWQPDTQHAAATVGTLAPAIAALDGGASDALVVYASASGTLYSTSRSAGAWSTPAEIDANAFTGAAPSLVALPGGRAMMTYLGTNGLPYFSLYDPAAASPWTSPSAIGAGTAKLSSPPSVAPGVCGDDAVVVLTEPAGVAALRYAGGAWSAPSVLAGTAGMTFASVASQP
jgi:hypothetical protein